MNNHPVAQAAEEKVSAAKKLHQHKRAKYTSYLAVSVAVVMLLVVGLNVVVGLLADRYHLELDFTADSLFSLSKESEEYVKDVNIPVTVYMLNSRSVWEESANSAQILSMVRSYAAINDQIKVEFVDLDENPTFQNNYPKLELVAYDVIFETEYRYTKVSQSSLVNYFDYENYYYNNGAISYSSDAENLLTGALVTVCNKTQPIAYYLTGNGQSEEKDAPLIELLTMNSYAVETVNLVTGEIPTLNKEDQSVDFLVISAPTVDFTDAQLQKIDAFLRNNGEYGKHLVYFGSYSTPDLPNLYAYLAEWGIQVNTNFMMEGDTAYVDTSSGVSLLLYNGEDETAKKISGDLESKMRMLGTWPSQFVAPLWSEKEYITTHPLTKFSSGVLYTWDESGEAKEAAEQPKVGYAAVLAEKVFYDSQGYEKPASNVLVFGSAVQESNLLSATTFANEEYIVNAFNTLINKEETVHISTKTVSKNEITMTGSTLYVIIGIFAVALPVAMLLAGLMIWLRRRKL